MVMSLTKHLLAWPALGTGCVKWDVFIPFFLWPLTDGQGQGVSLGDEQRHFSLTSGGAAGFPEAGHYMCL